MDYKTKLKNIGESVILTKTPRDSHGFLATEISKNFSNSDVLFIAESDKEMELIEKQVRFFAPDSEILNFPAWDSLPYDRSSPKPIILANRIKALYKLATRPEEKRFFIITSVNAILQKCISPNQINNLGLHVEVSSKLSIDQISQFLVSKGYERQVVANNVGEFAIRGGIVDIIMQQAADIVGYRIDFFGEEVESIKMFDPLSQISEEKVKKLEVLPASEVILSKETIENFRKNYREKFGAPSLEDNLYSAISEGRLYSGMEHWMPLFYKEKLSSFFDYLQKPISFFDENIFDLANKREELIEEYYQSRITELKIRSENPYHPIDPQTIYLKKADLKNKVEQNTAIQFNQFDSEEKNKRKIDLEIKSIPDFALAGRTNKKDPIELMKDFVLGNELNNISIACLTESFKNRITRIFLDYGITCLEVQNFEEARKIKGNRAAIFNLPTKFGFYSSDFNLVGEQALFGEKIVRKKLSKSASKRLIEEGLSIAPGELIVHRDHGIGKFDNIHTISATGIKTDMIKLIYGGNDTLFVPVNDINLITRYGADNPLIQLDRLGVAAWKNRKEKVKKKIKIAAEALLKIAAARKLKKATIFNPEQHFYDEFSAKFPFSETEDQLNAITEIEEDLQKGQPMDRLICGDVGFGKTEVAMRAAANVVGSSSPDKKFQVAIITPTTLLCRQHYKNFTTRFEGTGIKVAQLSRLVSSTESKKTREELTSGDVQIVIGTHSLLQKNIKFKNLGLVIIDEEQHFGVAQKERLKELRNEVHILSLSATPIPRTLQMSLTGVKDLSLIASAPVDRLAIRNFVMPYDSVITREAVMREYNRGGRIFFVVPRIRDIEEMEPRLKILLPELKITHAHGKMTPSELDKIMNDFVDGKIDMLLSTTIIESGIDISEANTMIIYKADMFGLSQLYQLRGRVGRGKVRAYCYFMLNNRKKPSAEAKKKLEVMQNLDSLGVGFSVASHDMDIRGSGDLLGDEQSGHIKETGIELYQQMLLETIDSMKNSSDIKDQTTKNIINNNVQVKLGISLLIPEEYMPDLSLRMSFYKKIANVENEEDQEKLISEMTDRFGKLPEEIINLIEVAKLKSICREVGVEKLEANSQGILISFKNNKFSNPDALLEMVFSSKNQIKINSGQKLLFMLDVKNSQLKIAAAYRAIEKLKNITK